MSDEAIATAMGVVEGAESWIRLFREGVLQLADLVRGTCERHVTVKPGDSVASLLQFGRIRDAKRFFRYGSTGFWGQLSLAGLRPERPMPRPGT